MARYHVTSLDCSAEGMERLRSQSEFIALAYAGADTSPEDILRELREDLDSCDRGDGFDFDAARDAIQQWAQNGGLSLITWELSQLIKAQARGELSLEDDAPAFRLYVRDNWHGLPAPYPQGYVFTLESEAVALAIVQAPDYDLGQELARESVLREAGEGAAIWDKPCAFPIGDRFELGVVWLRAAPPSWRLVGFTARACYWLSRSGVYRATLSGNPPTGKMPSGYNRLDSLMQLKGESPAEIRNYCDESGQSRANWKALALPWSKRAEHESKAREAMAARDAGSSPAVPALRQTRTPDGASLLIPAPYDESLSNDSQAATMAGRDAAKPLGELDAESGK